jgi:hypothetical protein
LPKEYTMTDPVHDNVRSALNAQVEAFLSLGGEITEVPLSATGVIAHKKLRWARGQSKKLVAKDPT